MRTTALLIVGVLSALHTPQRTRIVLPNNITGARCVEERTGAVVAQTGREVLLDCSETSQPVRCDFGDIAEPLDMSLEHVCRSGSLAPQAAGSALVAVEAPITVTVEWWDFPSDRMPRTLATRQVTMDRSVRLPIARLNDRFVRFSRLGASPVTVHSSDLLASPSWTLPAAVAGGELVVRLKRAVVEPDSYLLRGSSSQGRIQDGFIAFQGVAAGTSELVPVYRGGIRGRRLGVTITAGQSTAMTIAPEAVGAAVISGDDAICAQARTLTVSNVASAAVRASTVTTVNGLATITLDECGQTVAGLRPGEYEASYRSPRGPVAVQRFTIARQAISMVRLTAPSVRVTGNVRLNGRPLQNTIVTFVPENDVTGPKVTAETNVAGDYEAQLLRSGAFQVSFRQQLFSLFGNQRHVDVEPGDNVVDLSLEGALLRVNIGGWDRSTPVDLTVRQMKVTKPGLISDGIRILPHESLPLNLAGLAFGEYALEATQHDPQRPVDRVAGNVVVLDRAHREVDISLDLDERRSVLNIVDPYRHPIPLALVLANGVQLPQTSPGMFSLANVAPGSYLTVTARGFTPMCHIVPNGSEISIEMDPGVPAKVQFVGLQNITVPRGMLVWPGSDCPMPLERFDFTPLRDPAEAADFLIANFPKGGNVLFRVGAFDTPDQYQPIKVGQDGVVRLLFPNR